jgi:hypothetical protein
LRIGGRSDSDGIHSAHFHFGHLLYLGAVVWLFFFFYVEGICQMDRRSGNGRRRF